MIFQLRELFAPKIMIPRRKIIRLYKLNVILLPVSTLILRGCNTLILGYNVPLTVWESPITNTKFGEILSIKMIVLYAWQVSIMEQSPIRMEEFSSLE